MLAAWSSCTPTALLLASSTATRSRVLPPLATGTLPELKVRAAQWPDDYDAVCAVRKPTEFVVESGGAGFMGQTVVIEDPEEAQRRRVQARLGSALRDNATVLLVEDSSCGDVVGTLDCVLQQHAAEPSASPQPRLLLRNLWVAPSSRRQGLARRLMQEAEDLASAVAEGRLYLDVRADNTPALALYRALGFEELDPPGWPMPAFMRGSLSMSKVV